MKTLQAHYLPLLQNNVHRTKNAIYKRTSSGFNLLNINFILSFPKSIIFYLISLMQIMRHANYLQETMLPQVRVVKLN